MEYNVVINGFHGTNEKSAAKVLINNEFLHTRRNDHWLGQGVYFFSEDPEQAMSWALTQTKDNKIAVVLKAVIEVNSSSILDLNTRTDIFKFNKMIEDIKRGIDKEGVGVSLDDTDPSAKHKLRCFVMDLLPKNIKVIKKNFILNKQPHGLNKGFMERINVEMHSVQVCVRDVSVIKKDTIQNFSEMQKRPKKQYPLRRKKKHKRNVNFKKR